MCFARPGHTRQRRVDDLGDGHGGAAADGNALERRIGKEHQRLPIRRKHRCCAPVRSGDRSGLVLPTWIGETARRRRRTPGECRPAISRRLVEPWSPAVPAAVRTRIGSPGTAATVAGFQNTAVAIAAPISTPATASIAWRQTAGRGGRLTSASGSTTFHCPSRNSGGGNVANARLAILAQAAVNQRADRGRQLRR